MCYPQPHACACVLHETRTRNLMLFRVSAPSASLRLLSTTTTNKTCREPKQEQTPVLPGYLSMASPLPNPASPYCLFCVQPNLGKCTQTKTDDMEQNGPETRPNQAAPAGDKTEAVRQPPRRQAKRMSPSIRPSVHSPIPSVYRGRPGAGPASCRDRAGEQRTQLKPGQRRAGHETRLRHVVVSHTGANGKSESR